MTTQITSRSLLLESEDKTQRALVWQLQITCETCGKVFFQIDGHHLRAMLHMLQRAVDEYPELSGEAGTPTVQQYRIKGPVGDPSTN